MKSSIYLFGIRFFNLFPWLGIIIKIFFLRIAFPLIFFQLKLKHKIKFSVKYRHSVLQRKFNPFLSDVDFSLVIEEQKSVQNLIKCLKAYSKCLKVIDLPQIYYRAEYNVLPDIDSPKDRDIRFIWYFRKYAWIQFDNKSPYEIYKKRLAFEKIESETLKTASRSEVLKTSDLLLNLPAIDGYSVCVYNNYLELKTRKRVLEMTHNELDFLISLLPGEPVLVELDENWKDFKKRLCIHEYLLSRSHLRLHSEALAVSETRDYLRYLERTFRETFNEDLVMSGKEYDIIL